MWFAKPCGGTLGWQNYHIVPCWLEAFSPGEMSQVCVQLPRASFLVGVTVLPPCNSQTTDGGLLGGTSQLWPGLSSRQRAQGKGEEPEPALSYWPKGLVKGCFLSVP